MPVKGPSSPLSSGAEQLEPLDPKELQKAVKSGQIAADLAAIESAASENAGSAAPAENPTLQSLRDIAANSDFSTKEKTEAAIRESARFMVKSRIKDKFREQEKVSEIVEELSGFVASDPFMHNKLLKILQQLKDK